MKDIRQKVGLFKLYNPHVIPWKHNYLICRRLGSGMRINYPLKFRIKQDRDICGFTIGMFINEIANK